MTGDYYFRILRKSDGLEVIRCDKDMDDFMCGARWVNEGGDVLKPLRFDSRAAAHNYIYTGHPPLD